MPILIITEKTSQARDLRAALGDRFGQILPAEGHLLRLAEPHEVNAAWRTWACVLLKPDGLYPTQPRPRATSPPSSKAIAAALKRCDEVILATDCDREGQLIGQEILEHLRYRGTVRRALFTAQDPKSLRQAFDKLKPNRELRPLYEAAVARQQADQIFNLSLTRTATRTLLARGTKGVIGIGRVKTPTLAIVCLRELEIRDFSRGLFRDRGHGQGRGRHLPDAPRAAGQGPHQGPRRGRSHRQGGRRHHRPAGRVGRASAAGAAAALRPAVAAEDLRPALGLDRRQDAVGRAGALRRRRQDVPRRDMTSLTTS